MISLWMIPTAFLSLVYVGLIAAAIYNLVQFRKIPAYRHWERKKIRLTVSYSVFMVFGGLTIVFASLVWNEPIIVLLFPAIGLWMSAKLALTTKWADIERSTTDEIMSVGIDLKNHLMLDSNQSRCGQITNLCKGKVAEQGADGLMLCVDCLKSFQTK